MRWFGPTSWGAPVNETTQRMPIPTDQACDRCLLPIHADDQGLELPALIGRGLPAVPIYFHLKCFFKEVGIPDAAHLPGVHDQPPTTPSDGTDRPG